MNINLLLENCYGCELCANVCPKNAIQMFQNSEGFYYPKINDNLCVDCNVCYKKCPQNIAYKSDNQKFYGFYKYDGATSCSSGGIATYLSKEFIERNGYVCGCVFDDEYNVLHIVSNKLYDVERMKNSKYLQSRQNDIFAQIEIILKKNIDVLYIGTPCQVASIKSYFGEKYLNLYTIDLVCHGVPSPLLFKYYKEWLENRYKSKLQYYNFRYKKDGRWGHTFKYMFENHKKVCVPWEYDKYGLDYKRRINYRNSCYNCKFANISQRPGDLTIGDFWGISSKDKRFDERGISSVISNSEKGQKLISLIEPDLLFECDKKLVLKDQDALNSPTARPLERELYYKNIDEGIFYRKEQPKLPFSYYIKRIVPRPIKRFLKRVKKYFE